MIYRSTRNTTAILIVLLGLAACEADETIEGTPMCLTDEECQTDDPCVVDFCYFDPVEAPEMGVCRHKTLEEPVPDCLYCETDEDCFSGEALVIDRCWVGPSGIGHCIRVSPIDLP